MKKLSTVLLLLIVCCCRAQDTAFIDTTENVRMLKMRFPPGYMYDRSNITAELGGNGGLYSINYQRQLWQFGTDRLFWSAGLYVMPNSVFIVAAPLSINWQVPLSYRHHLILGTGQVLIVSRTKGGGIRGTTRFGYRYNFGGESGRAFLEFAYTPFYSYLYNFQWDHWIGFSFGWRFKGKRI